MTQSLLDGNKLALRIFGMTNRAIKTNTALVAIFLCLGLSACKAKGPSDVVAATSTPAPTIEISNPVKVIYPTNGSSIASSSTFIVGAAPAGAQIFCNQQKVKLNAKGYFAHVVSLQAGMNKFIITSPEHDDWRQEITIKRDTGRSAISPNNFSLAIDTAQPADDCGVTYGDTIELAVNATPGGEVVASLGSKKILLRPVAGGVSGKGKRRKSVLPSNVHYGQDAAYGKVFQRQPGSGADLYVGFYKVSPDDHWNAVAPKFTLRKNGKTVSLPAKAKLTVVPQPVLAQTRHDRTIVRAGPGLSRLTPLPEGVRLLVDGWRGEQMRCIYSATQHVWIPKEDLQFESEQESGPAPRSVVRAINLRSDDYGADVIIPLNQRLPFQIEQQMSPNKLTVKVYGVTADTDWVSPSVEPNTGADGALDELVDHVTWKQAADDVYEVTILLKPTRQWGFYGAYDKSDLHVHLKFAPQISNAAPKPLTGLKVCVDPGHGGTETGSMGCGGMREADMNLAIALKFRDKLEAAGSTVTMTRTADSTVSLDERVVTAIKSGCDFLISVHNNALPDGRDPWTEHGTSSYWYHPQAIELAKTMRLSTLRELGFIDLSTRWQNLALTRPSNMVSVLYEVGFMINPDEYAILETAAGQEKAAEGLFQGLQKYLGVQGITKAQAPGAKRMAAHGK